MTPDNEPINLEKAVFRVVTDGLTEAIKARLTQGYGDNPLNKMIDHVVASKLPQINTMLDEAISGALQGDFKKEIQGAVTHKLARILVSKVEGELEKRVSELRASPGFRAKMTLAVEQLINEHSK